MRMMNLALKEERQLTMTVDKFGRVVIPQEVRETLGLRPGTTLQVACEDSRTLVFKVVEEEPQLEWKEGVLVLCGKGPKLDFDIVDMIKKERDERDQKIGGKKS